MNPESEECKTMVKEYFAWEGEFKHVGKAFNQGKIFKWEDTDAVELKHLLLLLPAIKTMDS